jgi:hypothetical protein
MEEKKIFNYKFHNEFRSRDAICLRMKSLRILKIIHPFMERNTTEKVNSFPYFNNLIIQSITWFINKRQFNNICHCCFDFLGLSLHLTIMTEKYVENMYVSYALYAFLENSTYSIITDIWELSWKSRCQFNSESFSISL